MRRIFSILVLFALLSQLHFEASAQSVESLRSQREKIQKEINNLNSLINEAGKEEKASTSQINLYEKKIADTKLYISTLNAEIEELNADIRKNSSDISAYEATKQRLLNLYSISIYEQWKARNNDNVLLYILASSSFDQAYRRFRYFREMKDYTKRQVREIEMINDSLRELNVKNKELLDKTAELKREQDEQNAVLSSDMEKERKVLDGIKSKERQYRAKLNKEIENRKKLDAQITKLIEEQVKKSGSEDSKSIKLNAKEIELANNFAGNRGRLPWPVDEGVVTEKFGTHRDPVQTNVEVVSDGITISTKKGVQVNAVFDGEVTSVIHIAGLNNVVLVKHGNYFTLYGNLSDVYVKQGQTVTTLQALGKLAYDSDDGSNLKFQIWRDFDKLNPELWLRH